MGGLTHIRNRAPFLAGSFAMWGCCFSSIDCLMIYLRQKDDPWNAIVSGGLTGGILAIRSGMNTAFQNAIIGAVILGLIEGVSIVFQSMQMRKQHQQMQEMQKMQIEEMKRAQRKAQNNPWEAGFEEG